MSKFKYGDVVQLNSGGAPLTVKGYTTTGGVYPKVTSFVSLVSVSQGGLVHEVSVHEDGVHLITIRMPPPKDYGHGVSVYDN